MRRKLAVVVFILSSCFSVSAQTNIDSEANHSISTYYAQGVKYKDGIGVAIDYEKAFNYFSKYFSAVLSWKGIIACISMVYVGAMVTGL